MELRIRVTPEFLTRLDAYCDHNHIDRSNVTRLAVTEYLDRHKNTVTGAADPLNPCGDCANVDSEGCQYCGAANPRAEGAQYWAPRTK